MPGIDKECEGPGATYYNDIQKAIDFECKLTECLVCNAIRFGYSPADLVIYRQYNGNRYRYWLSTKKLCQIK